MKRSELNDLIQTAIRQVAVNGRDVARVYLAIVKLDEQILELKHQLMVAETKLIEAEQRLGVAPASDITVEHGQLPR